MKDWQFNVLFAVAVVGTIIIFVAPAIEGLSAIPKNPGAIGGIGVMLAYVLQQHRTKKDTTTLGKKPEEEADEEEAE